MNSWNILKHFRLVVLQLSSLYGNHSPLLLLLSLLVASLLAIYTLLHLIQAEYSLSLVSLFILLLMVANLVWLKRINDFAVSNSIFLILLFGHNSLALMHNQLAHVGIYWTVLFPILAFMLKGRSAGLLWSTLMGSFLSIYVLLAYKGMLSTPYSFEVLVSVLINFLLVAAFTTLYCHLNSRHQLPDPAHEQLHYMATRDTLTGLLNRSAFLQYLDKTLEASHPSDMKFALLFLDLDRFKQINDRYGHGIGDKILRLVGKRLQRSVRSSDLICRYGGDEFLIMLQNISPTNVSSFTNKITKQFQTPFSIDDEEISLGVSVGVSFCPHEYRSVTELIEEADKEMYNSKKARKPQHS
ncbi:MAG: GGDEF domain-containing protein [Gammaproteobacteria bacterium]|nr:GGDEF domain-containing protein [Gammaproteobacteria bacterium]